MVDHWKEPQRSTLLQQAIKGLQLLSPGLTLPQQQLQTEPSPLRYPDLNLVFFLSHSALMYDTP